ncbi:MAG: helix-turn-helix transcriptional regulator [Gammaproteobacteria bacterium]|nr:helix-turn-helix transcriptional regulator [Gammaproteobacteria bacterium]
MAQANLTLDLRSYSGETQVHHHDYHQLVLPVSGELSMQIGAREGQVSAEGLALVSSGQDHGFAGSDENCFIVADVPATLVPELERLPSFIKLDAALAQYVTFLHQQLSQQSASPSSERQMLLLLIQLLKERFGHELRLDRRIDAVRSHLDENYQQPISLPQLAAIAHLSVRQLNEIFRRELGMTPRQYLIEKRMQRAWQLLANGALQVQQVAEQVGYTNLAAFSDRFRRHFGHSPRYLRRNNE